jgi:phosphate starvation-inducible protein PhoH
MRELEKQREMDNKQREMDKLLMRMEIEKLARIAQLRELATKTHMGLEKVQAEADKKELRAEAEKRELMMKAEADKKELQAKAEADKKELRAEAEAVNREMTMSAELEKLRNEMQQREMQLMMKAEADKKELRAEADKKGLMNEMQQQREMRSQIRGLELRVGMGGAGCGHHTSLAVSVSTTAALISSNESNGPSWNEGSRSAANSAEGWRCAASREPAA